MTSEKEGITIKPSGRSHGDVKPQQFKNKLHIFARTYLGDQRIQ